MRNYFLFFVLFVLACAIACTSAEINHPTTDGSAKSFIPKNNTHVALSGSILNEINVGNWEQFLSPNTQVFRRPGKGENRVFFMGFHVGGSIVNSIDRYYVIKAFGYKDHYVEGPMMGDTLWSEPNTPYHAVGLSRILGLDARHDYIHSNMFPEYTNRMEALKAYEQYIRDSYKEFDAVARKLVDAYRDSPSGPIRVRMRENPTLTKRDTQVVVNCIKIEQVQKMLDDNAASLRDSVSAEVGQKHGFAMISRGVAGIFIAMDPSLTDGKVEFAWTQRLAFNLVLKNLNQTPNSNQRDDVGYLVHRWNNLQQDICWRLLSYGILFNFLKSSIRVPLSSGL